MIQTTSGCAGSDLVLRPAMATNAER